MATRSTTQLQNRPSNVGGGGGRSGDRMVVDDGASGNAKWHVIGMLFFAIVCFMMLPLTLFVYVEAKKTNVTAQAALVEAKKIRAELKAAKKEENNE